MKSVPAELPPELSLVVPVVERVGDLAALYRELAAVVRLSGRRAEVLFVIDHRQQQVLPALRELVEDGLAIVLLRLGGSFGESAALTIGLAHARGEVVATVPAYFQVDPAALQPALALLGDGADLVVGRRHPRSDSRFNRAQSWLFHRLLRALTGYRYHDISCGFRVMRRQVARELNVYGGLHRFIPVLAAQRGFAVRELPVAQRPEDRALRYFGPALYLKRLIDLATVFFLLKFTRRPLRFFGVIGMALGALGGAISIYLAAHKLLGLGGLADRPLLLLGLLLIVLGIQSFSLGLLGEVIIFTHARSLRDYQVAEVISRSSRAAPRRRAEPFAVTAARQAS
jgi:glycosyltransferase involved in cell wall biosynthesis